MRKEISAHEKWHLNRRTAMISTNNRNGNENVIEYIMTKEELLQKLTEIEWDDFECKAAQDKLPEDVWETVSHSPTLPGDG